MANPLIANIGGRNVIDPTIAVRSEVREQVRVDVSNPFQLYIIGQHPNGGIEEVHQIASLSEFEDLHDPEGLNGTTMQIARAAFRPGPNINGAPSVRSVRIGSTTPPTRSSYTFAAPGPVDVLTIRSLDKGSRTTRFKVSIEQGTDTGKMVTVQYGSDPTHVVVGDNLLEFFQLVSATGGTVTIAGAVDAPTTLTTAPTAGGGAPPVVSITLSEFASVQDVANYLIGQGYTVNYNNGDLDLSRVPTSYMRPGTWDMDLGAAEFFDAPVGAIIAWLAQAATRVGPVPGVEGVRVGLAVTPPNDTAGFVTLAGGTSPSPLLADLNDALDLIDLDNADAGILAIESSDPVWHQAVLAWMDARRAEGKRWKAAFGLAAGTTRAAAKANAAALASRHVALFYQRFVDVDGSTTRAPVVLAGAIAGATAGMDPTRNVDSMVLSNAIMRAAFVYPDDAADATGRFDVQNGGCNVIRDDQGRVRTGALISTDLSATLAHRVWSESFMLDYMEILVERVLAGWNVAWVRVEWINSVKARIIQVLQVLEAAGVLSAGTINGQPRFAWYPPEVEAQGGVTTVNLNVTFLGENRHIECLIVASRAALSAEG